jgi:hypothetical protein
MNRKTYTVTLADGTVIDNLKLNGNNFISEEEISPMIFDGNCSPVIINDGSRDVIHDHMELVQVTEEDGEYWFILRDISKAELDQIKIQSDIAYIAMMADIEL